MVMLATSHSTKALLAGLVLLTAGLAGCADASGDETPSFESYEDAKQAPGTVHQPVEGDSSIELKMLHPTGETVETGETDIVFLLYDSDADEPIEDVTFEPQDSFDEDCSPRHGFCAEMPAMGHGTSPEESPEHAGHGVYEGMTNFSMDGDWLLNIRPMIDGEVVEFGVDLTAEGGDGGGEMEH